MCPQELWLSTGLGTWPHLILQVLFQPLSLSDERSSSPRHSCCFDRTHPLDSATSLCSACELLLYYTLQLSTVLPIPTPAPHPHWSVTKKLIRISVSHSAHPTSVKCLTWSVHLHTFIFVSLNPYYICKLNEGLYCRLNSLFHRSYFSFIFYISLFSSFQHSSLLSSALPPLSFFLSFWQKFTMF